MWGPVAKFFTASATALTLIAFLNQSLLGLISTTWQGIPWWVGLVALIPLLFYAFVRASYEEYRAATEPRVMGGAATAAQAERDRKLEQLERRARRAEQEYEKLRASLADPTVKRQRDEKLVRGRSLEVAHDLLTFMHGRRYTDADETVARFRQRHQWKVDEVRERLEKQALLTDQERDTLTFRADDYPRKIEEMAETLRAIGMGE